VRNRVRVEQRARRPTPYPFSSCPFCSTLYSLLSTLWRSPRLTPGFDRAVALRLRSTHILTSRRDNGNGAQGRRAPWEFFNARGCPRVHAAGGSPSPYVRLHPRTENTGRVHSSSGESTTAHHSAAIQARNNPRRADGHALRVDASPRGHDPTSRVFRSRSTRLCRIIFGSTEARWATRLPGVAPRSAADRAKMSHAGGVKRRPSAARLLNQNPPCCAGSSWPRLHLATLLLLAIIIALLRRPASVHVEGGASDVVAGR
jgi:hypothetical protein